MRVCDSETVSHLNNRIATSINDGSNKFGALKDVCDAIIDDG